MLRSPSWRSVFPLVLIALWGGAASAASLKLSKYPKVFKGEEGVSVTVVQIMPETSNQALVQVNGIDDEIDGKVFLHDITVQGRAQAFVLKVDGEERTRMRADDEGWWFKQYELYLPNSTKSRSIWYDEKASKKVNAQALLTRYEKSDKALQARRAVFNRRANEARHDKELAALDAGATKSCGSPLRTTIDWKSIDDATLMKYSIYSYCGRVAEDLESLCRNDPKVKPEAKKLVTVSCRFGKKLKLSRNGSAVSFEVEPETGNQDDFVTAWLNNEL